MNNKKLIEILNNYTQKYYKYQLMYIYSEIKNILNKENLDIIKIEIDKIFLENLEKYKYIDNEENEKINKRLIKYF